MNILIAGGTGYIGSHICVELLESGHDVVVIDDFSNSKPDVLDSIYKITGKRVKFYEFNVLDDLSVILFILTIASAILSISSGLNKKPLSPLCT